MAELSEQILVQCQPSFNGTVPVRVQVFLIVKAISVLRSIAEARQFLCLCDRKVDSW